MNSPDQPALALPQWLLRTAATRSKAAQTGVENAASAKPRDNVPLGILFMTAATALFAVSSALAKWLVAIYPVGEVMFFRSFSSLVVCVVVVLPITGFSVFATKRPGAHIAR